MKPLRSVFLTHLAIAAATGTIGGLVGAGVASVASPLVGVAAGAGAACVASLLLRRFVPRNKEPGDQLSSALGDLLGDAFGTAAGELLGDGVGVAIAGLAGGVDPVIAVPLGLAGGAVVFLLAAACVSPHIQQPQAA